ncbi:MAG TPA: hypothetical protein VFY10_08310 [Dehalococcoidia bacterium]|nr:hypothetical protein [Dehalococcoidia bacterium]
MKLLFLLGGAAAWIGVAALAVGMASLDEPVWGFFPVAAAVVAAWAIGEYLTDVYVSKGGQR